MNSEHPINYNARLKYILTPQEEQELFSLMESNMGYPSPERYSRWQELDRKLSEAGLYLDEKDWLAKVRELEKTAGNTTLTER